MQFFNEIQALNKPTAIALGCFDGVHIGHRAIISSMCEFSHNNGLSPTVFTFSGSPAALLGKVEQKDLTTHADKLSILSSLGVEYCISPSFAKIQNISPTEFIEEILIKKLKAKAVFCGFNHHFGKFGSGDTTLLTNVCRKYGVQVFVTEPICVDKMVVSSSRIRKLIENGEIKLANKMLERNFGIELPIVEGKQNGRKMGIRTVNQTPPDGFVTPKFGVYASYAYINNQRWKSITNVGIRPTVGGQGKNFETHIIEPFEETLYGQDIRIELLEFVRPERKFSSLDELAKQIQADIEIIKLS